MIWLCNIHAPDGTHYIGREVTEDDSGCHRDGPLYNLLPDSFEKLRDQDIIVPMDFFPDWYEGRVPIEFIDQPMRSR